MKRYWLLVGLIAVSLTALFAAVQALHVPLLSDPSPWLGRGGVVAAVLGVGLLAVDVLLPVPASLVMMANGALFGPAAGALLSLLGTVAAALLGFSVGRRGGTLFMRLVPGDERARADRLLARWGALAIIVTRPVPILADTVAILAGASSLSWRRVALAAGVGALPPSLLFALAGTAASGVGNLAAMFGLVLLLAGLFWVAGRWAQEELMRRAR